MLVVQPVPRGTQEVKFCPKARQPSSRGTRSAPRLRIRLSSFIPGQPGRKLTTLNLPNLCSPSLRLDRFEDFEETCRSREFANVSSSSKNFFHLAIALDFSPFNACRTPFSSHCSDFAQNWSEYPVAGILVRAWRNREGFSVHEAGSNKESQVKRVRQWGEGRGRGGKRVADGFSRNVVDVCRGQSGLEWRPLAGHAVTFDLSIPVSVWKSTRSRGKESRACVKKYRGRHLDCMATGSRTANIRQKQLLCARVCIYISYKWRSPLLLAFWNVSSNQYARSNYI